MRRQSGAQRPCGGEGAQAPSPPPPVTATTVSSGARRRVLSLDLFLRTRKVEGVESPLHELDVPQGLAAGEPEVDDIMPRGMQKT